jgi:hypothetical protein
VWGLEIIGEAAKQVSDVVKIDHSVVEPCFTVAHNRAPAGVAAGGL